MFSNLLLLVVPCNSVKYFSYSFSTFLIYFLKCFFFSFCKLCNNRWMIPCKKKNTFFTELSIYYCKAYKMRKEKQLKNILKILRENRKYSIEFHGGSITGCDTWPWKSTLTMREATDEGYHYYRMSKNGRRFLQPRESRNTFHRDNSR